ncbi:MAG: hypothetical protein VXW65_03920, partial [Pseudomonadota bacterium]|nr:hypothetical protein [Pseudomonadota bacterium]
DMTIDQIGITVAAAPVSSVSVRVAIYKVIDDFECEALFISDVLATGTVTGSVMASLPEQLTCSQYDTYLVGATFSADLDVLQVANYDLPMLRKFTANNTTSRGHYQSLAPLPFADGLPVSFNTGVALAAAVGGCPEIVMRIA